METVILQLSTMNNLPEANDIPIQDQLARQLRASRQRLDNLAAANREMELALNQDQNQDHNQDNAPGNGWQWPDPVPAANAWNQSHLAIANDGAVYNHGVHIGQLIPAGDSRQNAPDPLRQAVQRHYQEQARGPWFNPGVNVDVPAHINPQEPVDESLVVLDPRPGSPQDDHARIVAQQDDQFKYVQELDLQRTKGNRVVYLNRLLTRKLELDFAEAWTEFQRRGSLQFLPPNPAYAQCVYDRLQSRCTNVYNRYSLDLDFYLHNPTEVVQLSRYISFQDNIFNSPVYGHSYDHWFNLDTMGEFGDY